MKKVSKVSKTPIAMALSMLVFYFKIRPHIAQSYEIVKASDGESFEIRRAVGEDLTVMHNMQDFSSMLNAVPQLHWFVHYTTATVAGSDESVKVIAIHVF